MFNMAFDRAPSYIPPAATNLSNLGLIFPEDYGAAGDGIQDDSSYIQDGIAAMTGAARTMYFRPDKTYNLGGTNIRTTASKQGFISSGQGAILLDGALRIDDRRPYVENLRFEGSGSDHGLIFYTRDDLGGFSLPDWSSWGIFRNLRIQDKPDYAIKMGQEGVSTWNYFENIHTESCDKGVLCDMQTDNADYGATYFNMCRIQGDNIRNTGQNGFDVPKMGGLTIANTKCHGWDIGWNFDSRGSSGTATINAVYMSNNVGEGNNWDIHVDGDKNSNKTPKWLQILGGEMKKIRLITCIQPQLVGILNQQELFIGPNAHNVQIFGASGDWDGGGDTVITGTGRSWVWYGHNSDGPFIKSGEPFNIFDRDYPEGKTMNEMMGSPSLFVDVFPNPRLSDSYTRDNLSIGESVNVELS